MKSASEIKENFIWWSYIATSLFILNAGVYDSNQQNGLQVGSEKMLVSDHEKLELLNLTLPQTVLTSVTRRFNVTGAS